MSSSRALLAALWGLCAVALVVALATARVVLSGEREVAASTAALKAGDPHAAVEHARRAAGWYAPGAPHVRVAYERLLALGTTAEGLGDRDTALFAFRAVRTAALETRWLLTPHEEDLDRADRAIARLAADVPRPPGTRTDPKAVIEREQLEALARDESPRTGWVVLLVASAMAVAAGAVFIVRRAVTAEGHLDTRRALPGILVAAGGALIWLLSVWRA